MITHKKINKLYEWGLDIDYQLKTQIITMVMEDMLSHTSLGVKNQTNKCHNPLHRGYFYAMIGTSKEN